MATQFDLLLWKWRLLFFPDETFDLVWFFAF